MKGFFGMKTRKFQGFSSRSNVKYAEIIQNFEMMMMVNGDDEEDR